MFVVFRKSEPIRKNYEESCYLSRRKCNSRKRNRIQKRRRVFEIAPLKSRSAWFKNGTEKARKLKNEKSKRLIKSVFFWQRRHNAAIKKILPQKTPILSGFSLFLGQKSIFCAITVYVIFSGEFVDINQGKTKGTWLELSYIL